MGPDIRRGWFRVLQPRGRGADCCVWLKRATVGVWAKVQRPQLLLGTPLRSWLPALIHQRNGARGTKRSVGSEVLSGRS